MFELTNHKAKLTNVNPRAELHGEDPKPAFDLMFTAACSNTVLWDFHQELRAMLYKLAPEPDDLIEAIEGDGMTALRLPKLGSLKWDQEYAAYSLTIDYGLGGDSNIVLNDVKVDKFKIEAQEGGTVQVSFRVIAHPDEKQMGPLCNFIARELVISVTPPAPTTVHELFGEQKAA